MAEPLQTDVTRVLAELRAGDSSSSGRLVELVYDQLRALAGSYLRNLPPGQTLQPTGLVHEAYVRMVDQTAAQWQDRAHFFAGCAVVMRGILADYARRKRAVKRGGDQRRIGLTHLASPSSEFEIDMLDLDHALSQLEELNARQARIVEYRFFSGMTEDEIADVLNVSRSTVANEWKMARAWLSARIHGDQNDER